MERPPPPGPAAPRAAVVVVTWQSAGDVDRCFGSLARARLGGARVIAVDNGSGDGTAAAIREGHPWVDLVEAGANLGFAGGCDLGLRRALADGADFVFLLNPDTEVEPGFLEAALAAAAAHPRAGAIQSLLLLDPERDRVNTAGNELHFLGFGACGRFRAARAAVPAEPREIAFASGAAVLCRASALAEVGLLDEALFLYQEDMDLGWRLRLAGWTSIVAPGSVVFHRYAFSRNPRKYFYLERNRYLVLGKLLAPRSLLLLAPALLAAELGLLLVAARGGWLREKLRADAALLRPSTLRRLAADRRRAQATRRLPDREVMRPFAAAFEFEGLEGGWLPRLAAGPMRLAWRLLRPLL